MDRKIEKQGLKNRKKFRIWVGAILFVLLCAYLFTAGEGAYSAEASRLRFAEVRKTIFEDVIAVQGNVEPIHSFFLDAVEGGTVQEVFVEAGEMVVEGQHLVRLSNTQLTLDFMNRETQIVEQINNLRNTRMQMELNERNIREQVLDIAYEKSIMERQFSIDTSLYASNVIAKQQYEDSRTRYEYLRQKEALLRSSYEKDEALRDIQIKRIDQSIDMMERNLAAIRSNLENLTVRAPISGQLTSFQAEIGESKMKGENLGRIDVLDAYKVKALVDEHYLPRVRAGQLATFSNNNEQFTIQVAKVLPEVQNNQFTVEFSFLDSIPKKIRRGQTLGLRLALSQSAEATVVPRGGFYSTTGGKWVYVLSPDGKSAEKREIKTGRQNPEFLEVLEGLEPGEKVIVSNYNVFADYKKLIIE